MCDIRHHGVDFPPSSHGLWAYDEIGARNRSQTLIIIKDNSLTCIKDDRGLIAVATLFWT